MTAASRISSEIANLGCVGMAGRQRLRRHHIFGVKRRFFPYSHSACLAEPSPPLRGGHLPHWEGKENGRSFGSTCASNECVFAGSWRDVPYKYAALRVLTQCTTSLKAGMSDRVPLRFPHLSFIRLEPYPARLTRQLPHAGKALMRGRRCSRFAVFPMGEGGTLIFRP